jgi:hypothetical protein
MHARPQGRYQKERCANQAVVDRGRGERMDAQGTMRLMFDTMDAYDRGDLALVQG